MKTNNNSLSEITETDFAVLDFETTGTAARTSRVIEIGVVKVKNLKIIDTYSTLINPEVEIPYFITQLTGIKTEDVIDAPKFDSVINELINFIGESVIVAHNLAFDYSFLQSEFQIAGCELPNNSTLCTLKLARKLYPELQSKSLGSLVKHFRIRNKDAHRALSDAMATAKILIKMLEESKREHNFESITDILSFQKSPASVNRFRIIKKGLSEDYAKLPDNPGVYLFKDRSDKILYIGKAKSLRKRVSNHFSNTAASKSKKIIRSSSKLDFIETASELTALILEAELVKTFNPEYNSQLKKYAQNYYVKFDFKKKYPLPKVTSQFNFDGNDYFGPYNNGDSARDMVEIVNKTFVLRECAEKEFAKKKKCYLLDIERCIAPCINEDEEEYKKELDSVYKFLAGKNQHAVDRLLIKMKSLAEEKKYEQAALIRDTVNSILNQLHKTLILAEPVNKAHVMVLVKGFQVNDYILMIEGKVFIKDYYPENPLTFDEALEDYFNGTVHTLKEPDQKDLERMKIALSWFMNHRNRLTVFYLKQFECVGDLMKSASLKL
ncbi:MAG: GIY-YIG nuclease family protein [Bacteroidetes bacterium]|nr:GIY-YIG nuclease family protein [Bacteroidota bacterium]